MPKNRANIERGEHPPDRQENRNQLPMQLIEFPTWLERVKSRLAEVEQRYDLKLCRQSVRRQTHHLHTEQKSLDENLHLKYRHLYY